MAKLPQSEFQEIEKDERHGELLTVLKSIADRPGVRVNVPQSESVVPFIHKSNEIIEKALLGIREVAQKDNNLQPLIDQIAAGQNEIIRLLKVKRAYRIERNKLGLITRIVAE